MVPDIIFMYTIPTYSLFFIFMFYSKTRTRPAPRGNNAIIAVVVIVIVILLGTAAIFVVKRPNSPPGQPPVLGASTPSPAAPISAPLADPTTDPPVTGTDTADQVSVKSFTVTGRSFSFTPAEIRVSRGDKVKITFVNEDGFHDWVIDEFNARTMQINTGQSAVVEFTADKAGTFEYYCSVGQHRQMGMKGNLIVE